jgi:hypothetical protein
MRLNPIEITPIQVTITTEEILADLTYPAPAEAGAAARDRGARRARRSPAAVEAAYSS